MYFPYFFRLSWRSGYRACSLGLLIVYIAITIIRYIVEPKIVGSQIGMHPLFMLASMLLGLDIFGIAG